MHFQLAALVPLALSAIASASASPFHYRRSTTTTTTTTSTPVTSALWDGTCFYPTPAANFSLAAYVGRWYQVAGSAFVYTADCTCVTADYAVEADDATVSVNNTCQAGSTPVSIVGNATAADPAYGEAGSLIVAFPGVPASACGGGLGPNYIVQEYTGDFAIVQASNFSDLFILSRKQHVSNATISALIARAGELGSDLSTVAANDQTGCLFT